jgi:hypothetical protein
LRDEAASYRAEFSAEFRHDLNSLGRNSRRKIQRQNGPKKLNLCRRR